MATPNQPQLSDSQLAELEKLARAQERSVDEVLSEAVDRYIRDQQWEAVKRYGAAKSRERGLTEGLEKKTFKKCSRRTSPLIRIALECKEFRFGTAESVTSTLAKTSTFRFRVQFAMHFSLTSR